MGRFSRALKAGLKATADDLATKFAVRPDGARYEAAGRVVRCTHCEGEQFFAREGLVNTTGLTLLKLDWLNRSAVVLICVRCTQVTWFAERPERLPAP
jgi:hypothetical protein